MGCAHLQMLALLRAMSARASTAAAGAAAMPSCEWVHVGALTIRAMNPIAAPLSPCQPPALVHDCVLCHPQNEELVFAHPAFRVIRAHEAGFPAFYRVIWRSHVAEWSDLTAPERVACMDVVVLVEQALREVLTPTKVNLATLGNVVPHLHWHVIARFEWDSHFPAPVWAAAQPASPDTLALRQEQEARIAERLPQVNAHLLAALAAAGY